jgi:two-component sensor histidine kinase
MPGTEHAPGTQTSLEALVKTIIRPYGDDSGGRQRIEFDGTLVMAGPHAVTALALALHECATNAAKYGALSTPDGSIRIQWSILRSELHLTWCEFGGPEISAPPNDQGFGSILTQRSIAQLGGKIKHDWHKTGLKAKIDVPLDRLAN